MKKRTVLRALLAATLLVLVVLAIAAIVLPGIVERSLQGVVELDDAPVSATARARHATLTVADWHSDSLLWKRDLLQRSNRGHVDVPRLVEGNVAIQMFTAVTKSPRAQNYESNTAESDNITLLTVVQLWPRRTWGSLLERALYQAERLRGFAERAPERLRVVRSAADLREVLAARRAGSSVVAALLGIEGAHALDGDLDNLDCLVDAGYRMIGLQHFFDNAVGGSLHGTSGAGLTAMGRELVAMLEQRRVIIDVAHSSEAVVDDVLASTTRPLVVSHTGIASVCPTPRNISDAHMQRIAERGGIIAIGYWDGAVCDVTPAGIARSIRAAIDLVGEDHVALGSDFDGSTYTPFDASGLASLTEALLEQGVGDVELEKVMGGNTVRFLLEQLPP